MNDKSRAIARQEWRVRAFLDACVQIDHANFAGLGFGFLSPEYRLLAYITRANQPLPGDEAPLPLAALGDQQPRLERLIRDGTVRPVPLEAGLHAPSFQISGTCQEMVDHHFSVLERFSWIR